MASDIDDIFASMDKLLDMAPFFKCPECGLREDPADKNATFFSLVINAQMEVEVIDERKEFVADPTTWSFHQEYPNEVKLLCEHCQRLFPIPEGWSYRVK